MVRPRGVRPAIVLPRQVAREAERGHVQEHEIEHGVRPETRDEARVFGRETEGGGDQGVEREKDHREHERAWDGCDGVLGPQTEGDFV